MSQILRRVLGEIGEQGSSNKFPYQYFQYAINRTIIFDCELIRALEKRQKLSEN
jgi:hypothetical protein